MGVVEGSPDHRKLYSRPSVSTTAPAGFGRGRADRSDRNLRGVPVIGHGAGAISGSSPGSTNLSVEVKRVVLEPDERTQLVVQWRMRSARRVLRYEGQAQAS